MKTKIIYISGAEVFDMSDVRAAFEEVRTALNLGADTVLFGVPVDADNAIPESNVPVIDSADIDVVADDAPVADTTPDIVIEPEQETEEEVEAVITTDEVVVEDAPKVEFVEESAPKKRGRARKTPKVVEEDPVPSNDIAKEEIESEPVVSDAADEEESVDAAPIPILSVLASKSVDVAPVAAEDVVDEVTQESDMDIIAEDDDEPVAEEDDTLVVVDNIIEDVSVEDMITNEAPVDMGEKTLEELLESMTPLREDKPEENVTTDAPVADIDDAIAVDTFADTDATLEQLAAEFAQNEDKITAPKSAGRGKIGKLKNILPFKKAKRDDTGLMGDLFGWAGIAANDDDFSIPGFFKPTPSKN